MAGFEAKMGGHDTGLLVFLSFLIFNITIHTDTVDNNLNQIILKLTIWSSVYLQNVKYLQLNTKSANSSY